MGTNGNQNNYSFEIQDKRKIYSNSRQQETFNDGFILLKRYMLKNCITRKLKQELLKYLSLMIQSNLFHVKKVINMKIESSAGVLSVLGAAWQPHSEFWEITIK